MINNLPEQSAIQNRKVGSCGLNRRSLRREILEFMENSVPDFLGREAFLLKPNKSQCLIGCFAGTDYYKRAVSLSLCNDVNSSMSLPVVVTLRPPKITGVCRSHGAGGRQRDVME